MTATPNLFLRNDTLLGVCQGLGEEFGFNPTWLRIVLAAGVLWNPLAMIGTYLALGAVFAVARWIYPVPTAAAAPRLAAGQAPSASEQDAEPRRLAA